MYTIRKRSKNSKAQLNRDDAVGRHRWDGGDKHPESLFDRSANLLKEWLTKW